MTETQNDIDGRPAGQNFRGRLEAAMTKDPVYGIPVFGDERFNRLIASPELSIDEVVGIVDEVVTNCDAGIRRAEECSRTLADALKKGEELGGLSIPVAIAEGGYEGMQETVETLRARLLLFERRGFAAAILAGTALVLRPKSFFQTVEIRGI